MAHTLRTIDYAILQQCMHCGMCLPTCPTYDTTKRERNSPRGRIALMRAVADGDLEISREFADEMSYCLGCLACQTACPAGVELRRALRDGSERHRARRRATPAQRGNSGARITLRFLFKRPRALRAAARALEAVSALRPGRRSSGDQERSVCCRRACGDSSRRRRVWRRSFSNGLIAAREQPASAAQYRVALLTGCVQDLVYPDVNRDTADVLLANGCVVETPPLQPCCGSLHAHNGDLDSARELARRMIDLLPPERYDAIVSNAGGCGSHLRRYGPLLADDPRVRRGRARPGIRKVRDVHEWLGEIGCRPPKVGAIRLASHRDVSRVLPPGARPADRPAAARAAAADSRRVGRRVEGVHPGAAAAPASTRLSQPEQAERLLQRKVAHVLDTGATIVATGNPGCQMQIAKGLRESGRDVRVVHPISLVAAAYRREAGAAA